MAKLLVERFQKLAGIKTNGLALREFDTALQNEADLVSAARATMSEEESNDIVSKLEDILKTWETKEYASDEARYKEYYKDIENLVKNSKSSNETYGGGAARDTKDDMKKYPDPNKDRSKEGKTTRPGMGTGPYAP